MTLSALELRSCVEVSIKINLVKISLLEAEINESKSSLVIECSGL